MGGVTTPVSTGSLAPRHGLIVGMRARLAAPRPPRLLCSVDMHSGAGMPRVRTANPKECTHDICTAARPTCRQNLRALECQFRTQLLISVSESARIPSKRKGARTARMYPDFCHSISCQGWRTRMMREDLRILIALVLGCPLVACVLRMPSLAFMMAIDQSLVLGSTRGG